MIVGVNILKYPLIHLVLKILFLTKILLLFKWIKEMIKIFLELKWLMVQFTT